MSTTIHSESLLSMQEGGKASFTDKAKVYAVKAIDHTNAALEGAKQKVRPISCCNLTSSQISPKPAKLPTVMSVLDCRWLGQSEECCALLQLYCAIMLSIRNPSLRLDSSGT